MSSATTDISEDRSGLVARLSLEQKVRLLTGADAWVLHGASTAATPAPDNHLDAA